MIAVELLLTPLYSVHLIADHFTHVSYKRQFVLEVLCVQYTVGNLPMVFTRVVSPPGNYSVRIVASTGEDTVHYIITDTDPSSEQIG